MIATFYSYGAGILIFPGMITHPIVKDLPGDVVEKMWTLPLFKMYADKAMWFALLFAMWFNFLKSSPMSTLRRSHFQKMDGQNCGNVCKGVLSLGIFASDEHLNCIAKFVHKMKNVSEWGLLRLFIPIIPLYVLGFIMKFSLETSMGFIVKDFGPIFAFNFACIILFVACGFLIAGKFKPKAAFIHFKKMLPATVTGCCSMSGLATLPIIIQEEDGPSSREGKFTRLLIPATVNVHAIGDVINASLSGLALLLLTSHGLPSLSTYVYFAVYNCLAQFSCVSVPGGGIIVMSEILQKHLGLDADSVVLLTSIYFLLEPFLSAMNVAYNGAFRIALSHMLDVKKI
jgi:Na+/H+-dicarboxylate symporter